MQHVFKCDINSLASADFLFSNLSGRSCEIICFWLIQHHTNAQWGAPDDLKVQMDHYEVNIFNDDTSYH